MKLITELPLRRILPITIVLFALLMLALAFGLIKPYLGQLLHQNMEDSLRYTLNRLQGTTEYMLGRGDLEGVKREVAASSAHREVKYLLVTDPQGQVIASSRLAQVGRPLNSIGLHFAPELIAQAITSRQPIYQHQSVGENTLYGLMPYIYFDQSASLQDNWGLVLVELDLERSMAPLLHRLDRLFVWVASGRPSTRWRRDLSKAEGNCCRLIDRWKTSCVLSPPWCTSRTPKGSTAWSTNGLSKPLANLTRMARPCLIWFPNPGLAKLQSVIAR
jgi:hypothetical protein